MNAFVLVDAGLVEYSTMYETQRELVEARRLERIAWDHLIVVEHPDVYTVGRKSKEDDEALMLPNTYAVERGGEATFHNPGQLVAYPILKLKKEEQDLHSYLRKLESTIIDVLHDFNIEGERREGATGVWVLNKEKKIASIGVAVSSWVTYHGIALNVRNDLAGFERIHPCGFSSEVMTSMERELEDRK